MGDVFRRTLLNSTTNRFVRAVLSRRTILSASYGQQSVMKNFIAQRSAEVADQNLATICLNIDRCAERNMPFSSLTVDSMVHTIADRSDIDASMYYLYKFRHGDCCYFMRPWTVHVWFGKCLTLGAIDLAATALDNRSQYGMFPDDVIYLLLIDKCIKNGDYKLAFKFVTYTFLLEALNTKLSQLTCLHVLMKMMEAEDSISPTSLQSLEEKRNFFAICFRLGQSLDIKSLKILGMAELGTIEKEHGIRAIYQQSWSPLLWTEGYLKKAVSEFGEGGSELHKDVLDHVGGLVSEDEELRNVLDEKVSAIQGSGNVTEEPLTKTLQNIVDSQLADAEKSMISDFNATVESWINEHNHLSKVEKLINAEKFEERQKYFEELRLKKISKKMAIEKLGYWEFMSEEVETNELEYHLRDDYIDAASSDVEIETRIAAGV